MDDKDVSPTGWYVGSYLIRFAECDEALSDDPEERFSAWENTVIVKASDMDEAYRKITALGKEETRPYRGGKEGKTVRWIFEGVTELLPIYEKLEDGAEIMWRRHYSKKLKNLKKLIIRSSDGT